MSELPSPVLSTDEPTLTAPMPADSAVRRRWRAGRSGSSPYAHKFRIATAVLAGLALGAIVVAVTIASGGRTTNRSVAWSSWSPADDGALGARDIADYVAPFYRISAVDQLAVVTVVNLESATAAAQAAAAAQNGTAAGAGSGLQVAVRPSPTSTAVSLLTGNTIAFDLCGIGANHCAIGLGQPSSDRLLLLRREALELALYTFKYISGVQNVIAILPPAHAAPTSSLTRKLPTTGGSATTKPIDMAVLFVHQELQPLLNHPRSATFPEPFTPTVAQVGGEPEAGLVEQVTARGLFSEQLQQAQDGSSLIVLSPLPPQ